MVTEAAFYEDRVANLEKELLSTRTSLNDALEALASSEAELSARDASLATMTSMFNVSGQELLRCKSALAEIQSCIWAADVPVITVDCSGLVTQCNQKAAEVFGCTALEALQKRFADFMHISDRSAFESAFANKLKSNANHPEQGHFQIPFRVKSRLEHSWQEMLFHASIVKSGDDSMKGLFCVGQDITELKKQRMEAELIAEDLTRLVWTVNAPIIGVDKQGLITEWNRKAEQLIGYSKEEALGKSLVHEFINGDYEDTVQLMLSQGLSGQETRHEVPLYTKNGQRLQILLSAMTRRDRHGDVVGVICVGQDITELRLESKMLQNYAKICGAAVWSMRGNAVTGTVTECMTKEIEHLISQQAQMDICDPRMVLWRACFVSILKTMCQNFWMRRQGKVPGERATTNFGYEFCFEAPNGQVKWYKVEGHLIEESSAKEEFEVTGSMQECTSMWIDMVMGDRWQKWWSRMCHMVFDATLLVDTQEYRVLNAWGEDKIFGCKLQNNHPVLKLIKADDSDALKEAFNEVTFRGFERGRTLHLLRPGDAKEMPAQCFLLSADQENPNECMMGIRMEATGRDEGDTAALWDVARPNRVLTLEDLARLKSGLKQHRRQNRHFRNGERLHCLPLNRQLQPRSNGGPKSLTSIPEDLHGESEGDDSVAADSMASDTESAHSSSKSSNGSVCSQSSRSSKSSRGSLSGEGASSSTRRSLSEARSHTSKEFQAGDPSVRVLSQKVLALRHSTPAAPICTGPPIVKLRWSRQAFDVNLDDFDCFGKLRENVFERTGVPQSKQTLIFAGRRLPMGDDLTDMSWDQLKASVRPGQTLMLIGRAPSTRHAHVDRGKASGEVLDEEQAES